LWLPTFSPATNKSAAAISSGKQAQGRSTSSSQRYSPQKESQEFCRMNARDPGCRFIPSAGRHAREVRPIRKDHNGSAKGRPTFCQRLPPFFFRDVEESINLVCRRHKVNKVHNYIAQGSYAKKNRRTLYTPKTFRGLLLFGDRDTGARGPPFVEIWPPSLEDRRREKLAACPADASALSLCVPYPQRGHGMPDDSSKEG
jgi:hypothetical protein